MCLIYLHTYIQVLDLMRVVCRKRALPVYILTHMNTCMYVYIYTYAYIYTCILRRMRTLPVYILTNLHTYMYMCMCTHTHILAYTYESTRMNESHLKEEGIPRLPKRTVYKYIIHIYICIYIYIYMYIYMYIYILMRVI